MNVDDMNMVSKRQPTLTHIRVGECIAYITANPPTEKLLELGNSEMIAYAKKWQEMQ
jgi:hypothetical protein